MAEKPKKSIEDQYAEWREFRENFPAMPWRAWGSWFSWGSPIGLGLFFVLGAFATWILFHL